MVWIKERITLNLRKSKFLIFHFPLMVIFIERIKVRYLTKNTCIKKPNILMQMDDVDYFKIEGLNEGIDLLGQDKVKCSLCSFSTCQ
jgi:hypothetical protein